MAHWLDGISLVDGHHHFWELDRFPYRWLAPDAPPARFGDKSTIRRDYLPADHMAAFGDLPLCASVHVQANCGAADPVDETRWLQHLSDSTGWPNAIIAEVDLCHPDAAAQIAGHLTCPALRGIRTPVAWDEAGRWRVASKPGVPRDPGFRRSLAVLEAMDLCLECVVVPQQLIEIAELARDHPALKIVINHFGTLEPAIPGNAQQWREGIVALASAPNVYMKLSGLWTVDKGWQADALKPHVLHLLSSFGAERVLYGSNLPVEGVNCPLQRQFQQLEIVLRGQPKPVLNAIFSETARRVYRL
ncbi:amidohydrolase family protein [Mameliella sediminis]|uniref:amidohydrolase family protein n=1 Tax=Mameliella sediminis TaxID=2836866 RepID=UPI001C4775BE|nr:amidohydrolase family protein [Mameliella sediminis]MBV7396864.1 amidohydrolase family protein [Mameliella sediminis]